MAFRVAHLADVHLCERVRYAGTCRVLEAFVAAVEAAVVDLVIIAGDLVDPRRAPAKASPAERNFMIEVLRALSAVAPVVVVRGNHDALGDWSFVEHLAVGNPIHYAETPHTYGWRSGSVDVLVHAVPWLSPSWFAEQVAALDLSVEEGNAWIEDAVRPLFAGIRTLRDANPNAIRIGVGHLSVRGGSLANGQALVGHEVQVGAAQLASLGLDYFGLGHLHEAQQVASAVWYAGSPNRLDFGEAGKRCGWLLATIDSTPTRSTKVEFMPLPADRLVTIEAQLNGGDDCAPWLDVVDGADANVADADVRVRVLIPEGLHGEDAISAFVANVERLGGRPTVQRITVAALRARQGAEEVAGASTIADKVRTYLGQRDHDPKQVDRVVLRLEAIEGAER